MEQNKISWKSVIWEVAREQSRISLHFMLITFFRIAYGGWLVTRVIDYGYQGYLGLPVNAANVALAYCVAIMWYFFWNMYVDIVRRSEKFTQSLLDLNDEMFKDMEAQRRYMAVRESMHD